MGWLALFVYVVGYVLCWPSVVRWTLRYGPVYGDPTEVDAFFAVFLGTLICLMWPCAALFAAVTRAFTRTGVAAWLLSSYDKATAAGENE